MLATESGTNAQNSFSGYQLEDKAKIRTVGDFFLVGVGALSFLFLQCLADSVSRPEIIRGDQTWAFELFQFILSYSVCS